MDFKLTEEQQMLQETAERLVRDVYDFESRNKFSASEAGFSTAFWQQLGELGLTAIPFSVPVTSIIWIEPASPTLAARGRKGKSNYCSGKSCCLIQQKVCAP